MTLKELKEKIDWYMDQDERNGELQVCIPNHKHGMGGTSVTHVSNACKGIDWDHRKFIVYPEVDMIEQPKKEGEQ